MHILRSIMQCGLAFLYIITLIYAAYPVVHYF